MHDEYTVENNRAIEGKKRLGVLVSCLLTITNMVFNNNFLGPFMLVFKSHRILRDRMWPTFHNDF